MLAFIAGSNTKLAFQLSEHDLDTLATLVISDSPVVRLMPV